MQSRLGLKMDGAIVFCFAPAFLAERKGQERYHDCLTRFEFLTAGGCF
jgi:hypothetical protein